MTIDYDELRSFLAKELSMDVRVESDDYYCNRSKRVTIKLKLGHRVLSEDSFSMVDGEPNSSPY